MDTHNNQIEVEQMNKQIVQGAQAECRIIKDEKNNRMIFLKIFHNEDEYKQEKAAYERIGQIKSKGKGYPFLTMLTSDDYRCGLAFPYIKIQLSKCCASEGGLHWKTALYHFTQIAKAVMILHQEGLTHCDLKIDNILVQEVTQSYMKDIIIDFGHYQELKQNETSTLPRGTPAYNPYDLNIDLVKLAKGDMKEIRPYSPYKLDLFQLGMLFLTMISPKLVSENNKKLFKHPLHKNLFYDIVSMGHKSNFNKDIQINNENVKDLIWQLLTGQIKEIHEIFNHRCYDSKLAQGILSFIQQEDGQLGNNEIEQPSFDHVFHVTHNGDDCRGHSNTTQDQIAKLKKEYEELKLSDVENINDYRILEEAFIKQNQLKIEESQLFNNSFITELQTKDLFQILLLILARNNNDLFQKDNYEILFRNKGSLKLTVDQIFESKDIELIVGEDEISEYDEIEDATKFKEVINRRNVRMNIEIVTVVIESDKSERRSLIFDLVSGNQTDFCSIVSSIQSKINYI